MDQPAPMDVPGHHPHEPVAYLFLVKDDTLTVADP